MKKVTILLGVSGLTLALLVVAGVYAQGPTASSPPGLEGSIQASSDTINFQGRLYTAAGAPVPAGNYNMRFTVCSASDCSSTVWGPTEFTAAVDSQGLFNVLLTSFNANHFTGDRWLRIEVCNTANQNPCTSGWDTMTPYQPMTSVAIAIGNIRKNIQDSTTASVAGSYVLLVNNTGSGEGIQGQSVSDSGVYGVSTSGFGVEGYASATGAAVHGVYGVAGTSNWYVPSTGPAGVAGCVDSSTGYGVWGYNNNTTGGWGLYGRGYYGAYNYSPYYVGAYARSDSSSGWGLAGHNYLSGVGIGAWSYSGDIIRGYSGDFPGGTLRLYLTNAGNLYVDGNYFIFLNPPGDDPNSEQTVLSAVMSPEVWFEDLGTATLSDGRAVVTIAPDFASTVNLSEDYHVFLTPLGECQGLYVAKKTPTTFEVRELGGGKANIAFDYRIVAKRLGYEGLRMQPPPEPAPPEKSASPQEPVATATATSVGVEGSAAAQVLPAQSAPAVAVPAEPKR